MNITEFNSDNDRIIDTFRKKIQLLQFLSERDGVLSPVTTTTYHAALEFIDYLKTIKPDREYSVELWDTFEKNYQKLFSNEVDMIIVPNAYHEITRTYWDPEVCHLAWTPNYGIAAPENYEKLQREKRVVRVACCKPIFCFIDKFFDTITNGHKKIEVVEVYSTSEAVDKVLEEKADMAVTNEASIIGKKLKFRLMSRFRVF